MPGFQKEIRWKIQVVEALIVCAVLASGCGTTKWSDTGRTGTEQLLISSAIDSAIDKIDFSPMMDKRVFLDTKSIEGVTDHKYLTMSLRQHLAASGSLICNDKDNADYVVEVRAGAVGTDRDEMLIGIPAFNLPSLPGAAVSGAIPEIPFVKRTKQRGVAKMAVFAYNKHTGRPVWASGNKQSESLANNLWFAGTGPLTKGNIYDKTTFAGHSVPAIPWKKNRKTMTFADEIVLFEENPKEIRLSDPSPLDTKENIKSEQIAESPAPYSIPESVRQNHPTQVPQSKLSVPAQPYALPYDPRQVQSNLPPVQ